MSHVLEGLILWPPTFSTGYGEALAETEACAVLWLVFLSVIVNNSFNFRCPF
jgi:hypothetical protein